MLRYEPFRQEVSAITRDDIEEWIDDLEHQYSTDTVRKALQLVRRVITTAIEEGHIAIDPTANVRLSPSPASERRFLTPEEVHRLAQAIDPRYRTLVLLGAYGGLRYEELAGLQVKRLDLEAGKVAVHATLKRNRELVERTKTDASRRVISIPLELVEELRNHIELFVTIVCSGCSEPGEGSGVAHIRDGERCGVFRPHPDALLFTTPMGRPFDYSRFRSRKLPPAASAAELDHFGTHALRHGNVAVMISAGIHMKTMQMRLGHKDVRTTLQMYGHLLHGADEEAAIAIGAVFAHPDGDAEGTPGRLIGNSRR